ncbi:MAG: tetratricopeptide repeat protein [Candidatus Omnitrophica bacterium]|nr:tetratricopeptide repeat protein [Candidatus Omnitrophota bacterium]
MRAKKIIPALPCLLILTLGFCAYANTFSNDFVYDARILIRDNPAIRSWSLLPLAFSSDLGSATAAPYGFYRPMQTVSYMFDYAFWKLNPRGYHLTNILLHALVAILAYLLLVRISSRPRLSLITALIYVVHPIHTESVTNLAGRSDSLYVLFMLLAFLCYLRYASKREWPFLLLMLLSYWLSLLSKEQALIFPVLLLAYHAVFRKPVNGSSFMNLVLLCIIFILLRSSFIIQVSRISFTDPPLLMRLPGFFAAVTAYVRLLLVPVNFCLDYGRRAFFFSHPSVLAGVCITAIAGYTAVRNRNRMPVLSLAIAWFFVCLLPVSNLVVPLVSYMRIHYLYLSSMGFFLCIAYGILSLLGRLKRGRLYVALIIVPCLVFLTGRTFFENRFWRDPITFYERLLQMPGLRQHASFYNDLGVAYHEAGRSAQALEAYRRALEIDPRLDEPYHNLGVIYLQEGREKQALPFFHKAISINGHHVDAHLNIGNIHFARGDYGRAQRYYLRAIELNSSYADAHYNLGNLYRLKQNITQAEKHLRMAVRLNPSDPLPYHNLAALLYDKKEDAEAIRLLRQAIALDPDYAKAYDSLSRIYAAGGQSDKASVYADKARQLGYTGEQ